MNGFGPVFEVRQHLLEILEWSSPPAIGADLPSYTQFQSCFPARRYIPFVRLLSGVLPSSERPAKRVRASAPTPSSKDDEADPWSKRLRPRTRGRVITAKATPKPAPIEPATPKPTSSTIQPVGPMVSCSGHALSSLRRFPTRVRRTHSSLPESSGGLSNINLAS